MPDRICSIEGCTRKHKGRNLCATHLARLNRTGSTELRPRLDDETRFWEQIDSSGDCWLWTGSTYPNGYGRFWLNGKMIGAHRFAYESSMSPIPQDHHIDHRCHEPLCCRPAHLRLATNKENGENRIGPSQRSTSGIRGVYWKRDHGRWVATIGHNYQQIHVGYFDSREEAESAVIAKRNELYTHNDADRIGVS